MITCTYHGHSFVEIEYKDKSIMIDPYIGENPQCDITLEEAYKKNINAIVLTHGHHDHIADTLTLVSRNKDILVIGAYELIEYLKSNGVTNVHSMHIGGEQEFFEYAVKLVPAVHGTGIDKLTSGYNVFPAGVVIRINGKNIHHAGDTGLTYDMKLLGEFDSIDLSFLPIGGNFTMDVYDAKIATSFIQPKIVVPIHYNTWPLINADPQEFAKIVMAENLSVPKILKAGQSVVIK